MDTGEINKDTLIRLETSKKVSQGEISTLIHELHVHQIELEAQNEELRNMQHRLEEVRDQYTDLFDFAPISYFIMDEKGVILNLNLTGCNLLGINRSRIKGKPFSIYITDGSKKFFAHIKKVFKTRKLESCELFLKHKNGNSFNVLIESIAEKNENGKITCCRSVVRDLTGEKKALELQRLNAALKKEKEKAEQYLQLSGVFFIALDMAGNISMINKAGCKILGCSNYNNKGESDLLGINFFDQFIIKSEQKERKAYFNKLIKDPESQPTQTQNTIVTTNGEERMISWNNTVLKDSEGIVSGVLSSGEDITEKRLAELAVIESEKMFRTLFETASESILLFNDEGKVVAANNIASKVFGYDNKEFIDKNLEEFIPSRFAKNHSKHHKAYLKNPESRTMGGGGDIFALKKDGEEFPVEISLSNIKNNNESLTMALITDITKQKAAKEKLEKLNLELEQKVEERTLELKDSQRIYKMIAQNFPNGYISVLDKEFNYVFVDGMDISKRGGKPEEFLGTNFIQRLTRNHKEDVTTKLTQVFKGKDKSFELRMDGKEYLVNAVGLSDDKNRINQILLVTQNIGRLKKAEHEIKKSLEQEQNLNELKTRFVSMASHEFRTPLTAIMNSITLLSKYVGTRDKEAKQLRHVSRIKTSIHQLTSILNDFLSLDKLETGMIEIHPSPFNILEFSLVLVDNIRGAAKKGQVILYEHTGELDVIMDKQLLKNILNNLLSNAVKYSPENGEIKLETNLDGENLTAYIRDNGIGIPLDEQDKIFDRFFRTRDAINVQGTGLGLNIVKKYVEMAKGDITVKSEYHKGTEFKITLPLSEGGV